MKCAANGEKLTYSVREVANLLGINTGKCYKLAREKSFPAIRLGRRILIPRAAFERWLEEAALSERERGEQL